MQGKTSMTIPNNKAKPSLKTHKWLTGWDGEQGENMHMPKIQPCSCKAVLLTKDQLPYGP